MRIGILEQHQALTESPTHFLPANKARRLVLEFRIAVECGRDKIQLTVAHSWSVIKSWLRGERDRQEQAENSRREQENYVKQSAYRAKFPKGAEYGFSQWPAKDQRSLRYV
jgi:hypothetical protein